jgi:hypothetical protein
MEVKNLIDNIKEMTFTSFGNLTITKQDIFGTVTGNLKDAHVYIEEDPGIINIMSAKVNDLMDTCGIMISEIAEWDQSDGEITILTQGGKYDFALFTIAAA